MFEAVIVNENMENDDVMMQVAINYKLIYKGGQVTCEASSENGCDDVVYHRPKPSPKPTPVRLEKEPIRCSSPSVITKRSLDDY